MDAGHCAALYHVSKWSLNIGRTHSEEEDWACYVWLRVCQEAGSVQFGYCLFSSLQSTLKIEHIGSVCTSGGLVEL